MTSQARKDLEAQFAIGLESAAALAAQGKSVCCVINESRDDGTTIVRMHPEFRGRLQYGTELYVRAVPKPAQQYVVPKDCKIVPRKPPESALAKARLAYGNATVYDVAHVWNAIFNALPDVPQPVQQPEVEPAKPASEADMQVYRNISARYFKDAAPQPAQPAACVGPGKTAEQTLAQWDHDLENPLTPEQANDFARRERAFAAQQPAQQPVIRYEPTDEGIGND